ncbi:hypothetical protein BN903_197 [Halorubrum sp. AJ67]|nr:hypothetical protein BN903_197 [Halorubrum sp. AJ67]
MTFSGSRKHSTITCAALINRLFQARIYLKKRISTKPLVYKSLIDTNTAEAPVARRAHARCAPRRSLHSLLRCLLRPRPPRDCPFESRPTATAASHLPSLVAGGLRFARPPPTPSRGAPRGRRGRPLGGTRHRTADRSLFFLY